MKKISIIYKSNNESDNYWLHPLNWLRLLVLSLSRSRDKLPDKLTAKTFKPIPIYQIATNTKKIKMKSYKLKIKSAIMLLLLFSALSIKAQNPYPNTGDHQVCLNATEPYGVPLTVGSTYAWSVTPLAGGNGTISPGATPNLITINWTTVGTATLQVIETNSFGCVGDPVTIIVTINPSPSVTVNSSAICSGALATITATPGTAGIYNYVWTVPIGATNPGNVVTFTSGIAGIYSVVITNTTTGCSSASASGIVTVNASPTLVITNPATVCLPATADLTAAAVTTGSTPGLTFTYWTDAAATIPYTTPTVATAGTYYIKGTLAGGCFAIQPVVVTSAPTPTVVVTNPAAVCAPNIVDLTLASVTAGSTGGLTFTYWTDAGATIPYATPNAAPAGTYYIKGTSAAGCFDIKPVVVTTAPAPTVVVTNPAPVCAPNTVDLTVAAVTAGSTPGLTFTYWTDAAATIPYTTPTTATAGTYYIKGTTAGGCFAIQAVVVTVNPLPVPAITGPSPVCVSATGVTSTYTTTNVAGHTYNWTVAGGTIAGGQGTNTITVTWTTAGAGSVSVTQTITATGCSGNNTLNVTVNPKPVTSPITHN
jgi:large repetitive protein